MPLASSQIRRAVALLFAALLLNAQTALPTAQTKPGGLHGTVTDSSGAVIPAAEVAITGDNVRKATRTLADGNYTFAGLAPGTWKVTVAWPGFTAYEQPVTIQSGSVAQLPIQLSPATGRQEVNVTAEADAVSVEPDHNASATVVKGNDLDALPDDPDDLTDALAALAGPTADGNDPSIILDGFVGGTLPAKNTIKEIRLSQNPFSAEYDDLGFGRVEIITKPGTDSLHGSFQLTDSDAYFNSR